MVRASLALIGTARPEWYDRNPTQILRTYSGVNIAPHTATQRWTYTVPSGKKALVELVSVEVEVDTAATTAGYRQVYIYLTPSGGSQTLVIQATVKGNTVGEAARLTTGAAMLLNTGDLLAANTYDSSTGGTVIYSVQAKITEFDA